MKFIEFLDRYPTEEKCKAEFKSLRDQQGVICKKCKGMEHYWLASKEQYQCKSCSFRTTLKSGTVMENSKLPFKHWFVSMHLMTSTKKTLSALELQRQIGHKYYEPIWSMMHKIRRVMSERDELYQLEGDVEIDEGFYSSAFSLGLDEFTGEVEELKRGKGSQRKSKVLVMASFKDIPLADFNEKRHQTPRRLKYLKMKVVDDLSAQTVNSEIEKSVDSRATAHTDDYKSYYKLPEIIERHNKYNMTHDQADKVLPWVHKAIANSKNLLKAIHHCVSPEYLQNYLDEFCYKLNRRYFTHRVFDRLLVAAVSATWY